MGSIRRPIMETFYLYDDRRLMCSLDKNSKPAPEGASHYLDKHGYSIISNLFRTDKDFEVSETESILTNIFGENYKIKNITDQFVDCGQSMSIPDHDGMSLFIHIDANTTNRSLISVSNDFVELNVNESLFFDRNRVYFTHKPVESRYNLLGKLLNKLIFRKDDTFYRFICIDYVKE